LLRGGCLWQFSYEELEYFEEKGCQWKKVVAPKVGVAWSS
jgi:hypothetical protein